MKLNVIQGSRAPLSASFSPFTTFPPPTLQSCFSRRLQGLLSDQTFSTTNISQISSISLHTYRIFFGRWGLGGRSTFHFYQAGKVSFGCFPKPIAFHSPILILGVLSLKSSPRSFNSDHGLSSVVQYLLWQSESSLSLLFGEVIYKKSSTTSGPQFPYLLIRGK